MSARDATDSDEDSYLDDRQGEDDTRPPFPGIPATVKRRNGKWVVAVNGMEIAFGAPPPGTKDGTEGFILQDGDGWVFVAEKKEAK